MKNLVEEICRRENIRIKSISPLKGGQINQVFLVNNAYVIRIGTGEAAFERLRQETSLLQSLERQICVPKVYAFGQFGENSYHFQGFVRGKKLHWVWKELTPEQKDQIIADLCSGVKILHQRTSTQNLRKRLDLYHLIYALTSYLEWRKTLPKDFVEVYPLHATAKVQNFIFKHGTRMFFE
jgi:hypothetical protein